MKNRDTLFRISARLKKITSGKAKKNEWEKGELKKKGEFHDKNNEKGNQKLSMEAGQ
jgi:hypothetical protein